MKGLLEDLRDLQMAAMFPGGVGYLELLLLFALMLMLFGPERLPGIARKLGQLAEQMRKAAAQFQHHLLALDEDHDVPQAPAGKPKDQDAGGPHGDASAD